MRHGELLLSNGGVIMLGSPEGGSGPAKLGEVTQPQCITVTGLVAYRERAPGYGERMCPRYRSGQTVPAATQSITRGPSLVLQRAVVASKADLTAFSQTDRTTPDQMLGAQGACPTAALGCPGQHG